MTSRRSDSLGIYIALGSNLGDRERNLGEGLDELCRDGSVRVVQISRFHETEPVGGPAGQPRFLNAAAEIETELSPRALLERMLRVEERLGRVRNRGERETERNGPRSLDLDLLIFGDEIIHEPGLIVPHPRMWGRDFVLLPLSEIAEVAELRKKLSDRSDCIGKCGTSAPGCP